MGQYVFEQAAAQSQRRGLRAQEFQARVVDPGLLQCAAIAFRALHHARVELRGAKRDAAIAPIEQMLRHRGTGFGLGKSHAADVGRSADFHHVYTGHTAARNQLAGRFAAIEAGDQQTRRAMGQVGAQQQLFFGGVVVGHANQRQKALRKQHPVDGFEHVHEQGIGEQRHQHQDLCGALRGQRTCRGVGHVVQFFDRLADPFDQFGIDAALAAQGARDRDRTDLGNPGDIGERDAPTGSAASFDAINQGLLLTQTRFIVS